MNWGIVMGNDNQDLDLFFCAAQDAAPVPSTDLMARIMADAQAAQPVIATTVRPSKIGLFTALLATIGGWPAMAGMVTAAATGIWIGVNPPTGLESLSATYLGGESTEYLSDYMPVIATLDIGG